MERSLFGKLVEWKHRRNRKPLLLKGARQVGKTWLLTDFGTKEFSQFHTLNFERDPDACTLFEGSLSPDSILRNLELYLNRSIDLSSDLILLDEIQDCPRALTSLKYFAEEKPELAICCAGSYIRLALGSSTFPVDKVEHLDLYPMSFREFLKVRQEKLIELLDAPPPITEVFHKRLWEELKIYYVSGGMPEVVQACLNHQSASIEAFLRMREIQSRLIQGYRADFAKHSGKTNAAHINRVFENVPEQITRTVDSSVGRYRFKDVIPGYSKFSQLEGPIDWLIQSGLVLPVYIVDSPAIPLQSRRKNNVFKLYFFDIGLLGCMVDIPIRSVLSQDFGSYKGFLAENYVAQELRSRGVQELYSWKGRTSEIEFLVVVNGNIVPIEVKSGSRLHRAKSLAVYREKYNPESTVVVSAGPERIAGNRHNLPLYKVSTVLSPAVKPRHRS
jgi:predicted AAA+ superfamily ATPase